MSDPDTNPSIEHEPFRIEQPAQPDRSEQAADRVLPPGHHDVDADQAHHSISEEPDIFPCRPAEVIDRDWSCSHCGYNLRGLSTGHRCPECGQIELYRPPPADLPSYAAWYQNRKASVSAVKSRWVMVVIALVAGPWAILGAILNNLPSPLTLIVFGPVTEEVMKLAVLAILVEVRPYLFKRPEQILLAALGSALGFAIIENILYLQWYIASPTLALILWRWIVCTGLHMGCTGLAATGMMQVWQQADHESRSPKLSQALRPLVWAIVIHGVYNGFAMLMDLMGYGF